MKKSIVLFLFILCQQFVLGQNFSVGPILGLNYSNLRGDNTDNSSGKLGFAGGIFANYSITDDFGLTGQLLYSQQGAKFEVLGTETSTNFNYLQVPILGAYYFGKNNFKPKVLLGPQIGFLLSAKDKDGNDLDPNGTLLETTDFGATFGVGFNYNLAPKIWLNADVRYNLGLTDLDKETTKLYNSNLALMVGVSIGFKDYDMKSGSFSKNKK
jgi:outer membrane protein W